MQDARQVVKDATAIGLVATSGGLFLLRACQREDTLRRAGQNAIAGAAVAAPLAAGYGFFGAKFLSDKKEEREAALEFTAVIGALGALAAGALSGLASLAWDAFRG